MQHVYAVAGAKGGVGKTTTSINLGTAFAQLGWSAVVVETDLAMANVMDFLDIDVDPDVDPTLHDVLGEGAPVKEAIYDAPGDVDVLPSGVDLEGFAAADLERLDGVIEDLRSTYDVVLLDGEAGLSREMLYPLAIADETILVSSPRVASVRDAEKTKVLTERVGGTLAGVVFVESGTGTAPPVERIADFLEVDLLGHVPEDEAVPISQDAGRPVVVHAEESPAASAYRSIAADLETALLEMATHDTDTAGSASPLVDEAPIAEAAHASDLVSHTRRLEAEGAVAEFWEAVEAPSRTDPGEVIDEAFVTGPGEVISDAFEASLPDDEADDGEEPGSPGRSDATGSRKDAIAPASDDARAREEVTDGGSDLRSAPDSNEGGDGSGGDEMRADEPDEPGDGGDDGTTPDDPRDEGGSHDDRRAGGEDQGRKSTGGIRGLLGAVLSLGGR